MARGTRGESDRRFAQQRERIAGGRSRGRCRARAASVLPRRGGAHIEAPDSRRADKASGLAGVSPGTSTRRAHSGGDPFRDRTSCASTPTSSKASPRTEQLASVSHVPRRARMHNPGRRLPIDARMNPTASIASPTTRSLRCWIHCLRVRLDCASRAAARPSCCCTVR